MQRRQQRHTWTNLFAVSLVAMAASTAIAQTTTNLTLQPNYPGIQGTQPIGVAGDAPAGWEDGSWQANVQVGSPQQFTSINLAPIDLFGRDDVRVDELVSVSYYTKKDGGQGTVDWFFQFYTKPYTGSPGAGWYGHRINAEPLYSDSLNAPPDQWNQWQTEDNEDNRLRFYDSSGSYFGGYTDPFLEDLATLQYPIPAWNLNDNYDDLGPQEISHFVFGLGTGWAAGFEGQIDGIRIELTDGSVANINLEDYDTQVVALNADASCYGVNDTVTVYIDLAGNGVDEIVGGQFFLEYDDTVLAFVGADPGDPPFTVQIFESQVANLIDYAVGVPTPPGDGTTGDATMAVLTFEALVDDVCNVPDLVEFRFTVPPTRLSDNFGGEVLPDLLDLNPITIDSTAPTFDVPGTEVVECDDPMMQIDIDGSLADEAWSAPEFTATPPGTPGAQHSVDVYAWATADAFYFAFASEDTTVDHRGNTQSGADNVLDINIGLDGDSEPWRYALRSKAQADASWAEYSEIDCDNGDCYFAAWEDVHNPNPAPGNYWEVPAGIEMTTSFATGYRVTELRIPANLLFDGDYGWENAAGSEIRIGGTFQTNDGDDVEWIFFPDGINHGDANTYHTMDVIHSLPPSPTDTGEPTNVTDNCDLNPVVTFADDVTSGACPQAFTVERTWTVTDACGNSASDVQIIEVEDTTAPELTIPDDIVVYADAGFCSALVDVTNPQIETFDVNPDLNEWVVDRFEPACFESEFFDGDNRLKLCIGEADAQSSGFHNTQGRKIDPLSATNITAAQIDVYIPSDWATSDRRMAGFWLRGNEGAFPILEFTSGTPGYESTTDDPAGSGNPEPRFRGWASGIGWVDMGLPTGFQYDEWHTLTITLNGSTFTYEVGDLSLTLPTIGDQYFEAVFLQGYNTPAQYTSGVTYEVHWDNFVQSSVPSAVDNCDEAPAITFERSDDPNAAIDDPYPAGITTITWTATDACGNSTSDTQTIEVIGDNQMIADVSIEGLSSVPSLERCITFELIPAGGGTPVVVQQTVELINGEAPGVVVDVPCGDYECITARDPLHTLANTGDINVDGTLYVADNFGDLLQGDLNDDGLIDILDFGVFVFQYGVNYGFIDTPCGTPAPHADMSGSGTVGTADFGFIQINFLEVDQTCPGTLMAGQRGIGVRPKPTPQPRTQISVRELHRMGLGHLEVADLTGDGWVGPQDIAAFAAGARPE